MSICVCPIVSWFYFRKFLYLLNIINVSLYFLFNFFLLYLYSLFGPHIFVRFLAYATIKQFLRWMFFYGLCAQPQAHTGGQKNKTNNEFMYFKLTSLWRKIVFAHTERGRNKLLTNGIFEEVSCWPKPESLTHDIWSTVILIGVQGDKQTKQSNQSL